MIERLTKLAESIDRLTLRERLFLFAAGLFVMGGLWEALLAAPLAARERVANEKVIALEARLRKLDESLGAAAAGASEGVPAQLDRLRALRATVETREGEIRALTASLVDPAEMRRVLEELLRRQDGLTLVSAVNRPAEPLLDDGAQREGTAAAAANSNAPQLYRHSLVLKLRGSYLDCLRYLESVERLPWNVYWSRLELSADDYPVNDIMLELTTLSLEPEWIGV
jgi:MSHA biogenesis protein MshJ